MPLKSPSAVQRLAFLLALVGCVAAGTAYATDVPCWAEASNRYGVPVDLLKAVAQVESSNRARVIARNTNGSLDIGFMQINDWWLPALAAQGIGKNELLDACTNLHVGAWILKQGIDRYGYNWQGIGAYGAGTSPKKDHVRMRYANKVFRALGRQPAGGGAVAVARVRKQHQPDKQATGHEQLVWSAVD